MQAIVKDKHQRFCQMIEGFKVSNSLQDYKLAELESELNEIFNIYQHSLDNIKTLIIEYEVKQKSIRQRAKQLLRS